MPAYSNSTPPLSLFPGDVGFSFNAEAFPANGTAGAQFAIPEPAGLTDQGHTVRWQTIFGTAPSAIASSCKEPQPTSIRNISRSTLPQRRLVKRARSSVYERAFCESR